MTLTTQLACFTLLVLASGEKEQSRWSRQISSYTADISDWVPLTAPIERELPIKRQAVAEPRILTEPFPGFSRPTGFSQDAFTSRNYFNSPANRQLYLQSVPSAPQNYLNEQGFGQSIRFGLSQPNFPLNQAFVSPHFTFDSPQTKSRPQPVPLNPVKFDNYPKLNQQPSPQAKPFVQPKIKPEAPKFVDGYRVENFTDIQLKKKPQSLHKIKYESFDKVKPEMFPQSKPKIEREEVQLLYVPLESLNRGQFNFRSPLNSPQLMNTDIYSQNQRINPINQNIAPELHRPLPKIESFNAGQEYIPNYNAPFNVDQVPKFSTLSSPFPTAPPTTPKPKKLKPHQPPLAIFLTPEAKKNDQVKVGDVLYSLKNADTVAVLDSVNPLNAPKVFIGPSSLTPPENYVKFELPYLSNIENSDKKLKQLPFFVAPLSYNTPQGFAKIPFPSPHVGSVVINSQIKDTPPVNQLTTVADVLPNSYTVPQNAYTQDQKVTQKPRFSYYSTVPPKANTPPNYEPNYYSFEPQTVSTVRPLKEETLSAPTAKPGSYFLTNVGNQYNPNQYVNFGEENSKIAEPVREYNIPSREESFKAPEPVREYNIPQREEIFKAPNPVREYNVPRKPETTTTTTTTTTKASSTYPPQLLETHNPYSINQAFHFSTPVDYQNFFDEYKENYATPGFNPSSTPSPASEIPPSSTTTKAAEIESEIPQRNQQSSQNYLQNYTPEIHYESENQNSRYPDYNNEYTTKSVYNEPSVSVSNENSQPNTYLNTASDYNTNIETEPAFNNYTEIVNNVPVTLPEEHSQSTNLPYDYNQYNVYNSEEKQSTSSSSTTTTTTRRAPLRTRGRPRYTTPKYDSGESTTRTPATRRPLRERRPLPPRTRYEPNRITTEKSTRKSTESSEVTSKSPRTRTRGRVHYKPSESEEIYDKRTKSSGKDQDLAYQRDVLHQNYPVTLMERMSTVDIEAITEPTLKISTSHIEDTKTYDTENAYSYDKVSISQPISNSDSNEDIPVYTTRIESETESYVQKSPSTRSDEYIYQSRSSTAPVEAIPSYDEFKEEDSYPKQTTPEQQNEASPESFDTKAASAITEDIPTYSRAEYSSTQQEEVSPASEITKAESQEGSHEDENVVQTTPSYNRVRVRPGVIRQYHQASSTESTRTKIDRKRPIQAITYRPAYEKRRTTMRIDEIEAGLKTKQVHSRPEFQDYRHPVYKPEPSTEPSVTQPQTVTTKRGPIRRRRPSYSTTSTEVPSTRRATYEVKNRFRGRRPTTEKPTEKSEVPSDATSTTVRSTPHLRYNHRPRLSERYNKKQEPEETEDQDSNYSIHRPKYAVPENDQWSPKFSSDSFKPYNPNDVVQELKTTTDKDNLDDSELDIITAKNEYDDILISVTPATNNRVNKKLSEIPPTLEALVEQSKVTKSDPDNMSTFESMLEEVMKSLEEQDENEYTNKVMKHKGGEIGEIPPEKIISSGDNYSPKSTSAPEETTAQPSEDSTHEVNENDNRKNRRRGFWKKVKVRPVSESIETAESQYYHHTVNRLGQPVASKTVYEKSDKSEKPKVTTYKPNLQFIKDFFDIENEQIDAISTIDIPKLNSTESEKKSEVTEQKREINADTSADEKPINPGEIDLGTGSPDPTIEDSGYYTMPTEATELSGTGVTVKRSDGFSFMDYLFGVTSTDSDADSKNSSEELRTTVKSNIEETTEAKPKIATTESNFVPDEITTVSDDDFVTETLEIKKVDANDVTEQSVATEKSVETSSVSSFMSPTNVVSTSMSTEISHETEICFRGKCIKTNKDIL